LGERILLAVSHCRTGIESVKSKITGGVRVVFYGSSRFFESD
jgi:hypothetical protein